MIEFLNYILSDLWHFAGTVLFIWLIAIPVAALLRPNNSFAQIIHGEKKDI